MEKIFLEVEPRQEIGRSKTKHLRDTGFIPAIFYGEGKKSEAIKVSHRHLLTLLHQHQHRIESMVINLKIKDDKKHKEKSCLIKEIQYDPVHGDIIHVDFNEISLTEAIKVSVPVTIKGEPMGVKQEGGSLERILWEIEVECLPTDIPKEIEVEVSPLKIGDAVHVKDVTLPVGVKVLNNPEAIILSVIPPLKEEVPVAPVEGEAAQEPEVIKEKKEVAPEEVAEEKEGKKEKEAKKEEKKEAKKEAKKEEKK